MAKEASWTNVYKRIDKARKKAGLTWNQLAKQAGIKTAIWMTGLPISHPTGDEIRKIAPVVHEPYIYLRYGIYSIEE